MTREEAKTEIKEYLKGAETESQRIAFQACLYVVDKIEPKTGRWIPVSERLPLLRGSYKISDDVLITNGYENDMGYLVERKGKIFWHYYGGEYEVGIKDEDNDAIAWMPLPAPFEPQEGEERDEID